MIKNIIDKLSVAFPAYTVDYKAPERSLGLDWHELIISNEAKGIKFLITPQMGARLNDINIEKLIGQVILAFGGQLEFGKPIDLKDMIDDNSKTDSKL